MAGVFKTCRCRLILGSVIIAVVVLSAWISTVNAQPPGTEREAPQKKAVVSIDPSNKKNISGFVSITSAIGASLKTPRGVGTGDDFRDTPDLFEASQVRCRQDDMFRRVVRPREVLVDINDLSGDIARLERAVADVDVRQVIDEVRHVRDIPERRLSYRLCAVVEVIRASAARGTSG